MRILVDLLRQEKLHKDAIRSPATGTRKLGGESSTNARRQLQTNAPTSQMALSATNVGGPKSNRAGSKER